MTQTEARETMDNIRITQCKTCPWRTDCDPLKDIPNGYSMDLHRGLACTIAEPGALFEPRIAMACHYSPVGEERPCAGWLHHQIGPGNNIAARMAVMRGLLPVPVVDGDQHPTFEDTLPKKTRRVKERRQVTATLSGSTRRQRTRSSAR